MCYPAEQLSVSFPTESNGSQKQRQLALSTVHFLTAALLILQNICKTVSGTTILLRNELNKFASS